MLLGLVPGVKQNLRIRHTAHVVASACRLDQLLSSLPQCDEGWFGHDCAYRQEGVPWSPGREAEQPWLAEHVHTPAAMPPEPGATRLRPLIYIYELPPRFNQHMLQVRWPIGHAT